MTELTTDQLRILTAKMQERDPRFRRILTADDNGTGTYELRVATTGATATNTFTFCAAHNCIHTPNFDQTTRDRMAADAATAPNGYAQGLATLRASEAPPVPAPTFEERYQAQRRSELTAEYARYEARR